MLIPSMYLKFKHSETFGKFCKKKKNHCAVYSKYVIVQGTVDVRLRDAWRDLNVSDDWKVSWKGN